MTSRVLLKFTLYRLRDAAWDAAWRFLPAAVAGWLFFALAAAAEWLPYGFAVAAALAVYACLAAGAARFVRAAAPVLSAARRSRECDRAFPQGRGLFTISRELAGGVGAGSPDLADRARRQSAEYLATIECAFPRRPPRLQAGSLALGAALLAAGLAGLARPAAVGGAARNLLRFRLAPPASVFQFSVRPGDTEIEYGNTAVFSLALRPAAGGEAVTFRWRAGGGAWAGRAPEFRNGTYETSLERVTEPLEYYFQAGNQSSARHRMAVFRVPRVDNLQVRVAPPAYTGLPAFALPENQGDVTALAGSAVCFKLKANVPLDSAWLEREGPSRAAAVEGPRAAGCFTLQRTEYYRFRLRDQEGRGSRDTVRFSLKAVADEAPLVKFLAPEAHTVLTPSLLLSLRLEALDDFGFSRAQLLYRLARGGETADSGALEIPLPENRAMPLGFSFVWPLASLALLPDDEVLYRVRIWDNNAWAGPRWGETATQSARFPSLEEIHHRLQAEEAGNLEGLEQARQEQEKLVQDAEKFRRQLQAQPQVTGAEKERYQKLQARQEELTEKIGRAVQQLEQNLKESAEYKLFDRDLAEKFQQVQELFRQVVPRELLESLAQNPPDLRNADLRQVEQGLKNLLKNQDELRRGLERTLAQLKRLKLEQQVNALAKRLEELAGRHQELAPLFADSATRPQAARTEQNLAEKTGTLGKDAEQAAPRNEPETAAAARQLDSLGKEIQKLGEQVAQHARQSATQSAGQNQAGHRQQQQQYRDLVQQLESLKDALGRQQDQQALAELTALVQALLDLSREQEEIRNGLATPAESLAEFTEEELGLKRGAQRATADWLDLQNKMMGLPAAAAEPLKAALDNMQRSIDQLSQKNAGTAGRSMEEAMGQLNRAAHALLALRGRAKSGMGMSLSQMLQQMQGMSAEQQLLNQLTMQLMQASQSGQCPWGSGEKAEMAMRAAMDRLRQSQQDLADEMGKMAQQWSENAGTRGGQGMREIQEEMKQVADDLSRRSITPQTTERQEKILSRMLDYSQSVRERKFSPKRESQTGKAYPARDPEEIARQLGERRRLLQESMLRALQQGYAQDYRQLIKGYFEQLQEKTAGE